MQGGTSPRGDGDTGLAASLSASAVVLPPALPDTESWGETVLPGPAPPSSRGSLLDLGSRHFHGHPSLRPGRSRPPERCWCFLALGCLLQRQPLCFYLGSLVPRTLLSTTLGDNRATSPPLTPWGFTGGSDVRRPSRTATTSLPAVPAAPYHYFGLHGFPAGRYHGYLIHFFH